MDPSNPYDRDHAEPAGDGQHGNGAAAKSLMSITQVAKAAGVSTATVSRVLNEFPGVRSDTVRRVRQAIAELNYRPQRVRRLGMGGLDDVRRPPRTGNIAAITIGQTRDWLQLPIMAAVVSGIRSAASKFGYRLILEEMLDPMKPGTLIERREVDGAIVFLTSQLPIAKSEEALLSLGEHLPVVWAMGLDMATGVDHVTSDNVRIGFLANQYLREQGCRNTAFVCVTPTWGIMRLRGQAFLNAALDDAKPADVFVVSDDPMTVDAYGKRVIASENAEQLVSKLAAARPKYDGLFIANDRTTVELHPLMLKHGLQPGRNVTVVSCDNENVRLSALNPRPASIDLDAEQIGHRAVVRLIYRMERPSEPPFIIHVAPRLVLPDQG